MQKQARNELIVGLVFFTAMTLLGIYTIVISGLFKGTQKTYQVTFPKIYGLKIGDQVRVEGLDRGEVVDLRLLEDVKGNARIRARMRVSKDVEIYKDGGEVRVTPFSPLGGRIIEIKRGYEGPRGRYRSEEDASRAGAEPDMILGDAEGELLQTINGLVEENRPGIARIVSNLAFVSDKLTQTDNVIGALLNDKGTGGSLQDIASELAETSASLNRILKRIEAGQGIAGELVAPKSELHDNLNGALAAARGALQQGETLLSNANQGKSALGVLVSDDPRITADARAIVHDVSVVTSDLAAGQGSLGKLLKDDRLYEGAATTAENLGKITANVVNDRKSAVGVLLYDPETGQAVRSTLAHLDSIAGSIDRGDGAIGLVVKDKPFRDRVARIFTEVERLTVEFRDSVEDLREQAPINAFLGAVFSAF